MGSSATHTPATQAEAVLWRDTYNQSGVVVADPDFNDGPTWYPFGVQQPTGGWSIGLPGTLLLAPGMVVEKMGHPTEAEIEAALPGS